MAVYSTMLRPIPIVVAAVLLAGVSPLHAQNEGRPERERWQVTLDGERYVWDIGLVRLNGDSLVVRQADTLARLPVEHITEIRLIRKSEVRVGEGAPGGTMSALTGGDDEVYDLTPLEFPDRLRAVQKILLYNPTER